MQDSKNNGVFISNSVLMGFGLFVLAIAFGGGFIAKDYLSSKDSNSNSVPAQPTQPQVLGSKSASDIYKLVPPIDDNDHIKGNKDADIVLIEYSDYECPYCVQFHPSVKTFLEKNPDVAYVYRHLPLIQIHPTAMDRARGSECAAKIGGNDAFWKFSYAMFEDSEVNSITLSEFAGKIGLNIIDFDLCVKGTEFDDKINTMSQKGIEFLSSLRSDGKYGTPGGVIINRSKGVAVQIGGLVSADTLSSYLNSVK